MFRRWRERAGRKKGDAASSDVGPRATVSVLPTETAARQAAAGGSPVEMNRLGIILKLAGRPDEAADWFRKAAEAGNSDAMANLANYHMAAGRNKEAAEWFRRAGGPLGEALAARLLEQPGDQDPRNRKG